MLEQAAAQGNPVMMDFGAEWCFYCKKLERTTFRVPEVVKLSDSMVAVKVDLTEHGAPELERLTGGFQGLSARAPVASAARTTARVRPRATIRRGWSCLFGHNEG